MGKDNFVTETPDELLSNAEKDIINVKVLLAGKFYPEDLMYSPISFHVTMAVEKLLKSYIINNGKDIEKTHDLNYLCKAAIDIDSLFEEIKNDCTLLDGFVPGIKYGDEKPITKKNMNDITKSLNTICGFPPVKAMRDAFSQTHKFAIITE